MCCHATGGGGCALRVRVAWRTVCSHVCSHINRLGWEVSVCSDRSRVDGVLRRLLCEKDVNFFLDPRVFIKESPQREE